MRPKGSGYKSQGKILEALSQEGTLRFRQIKHLLDNDNHKTSRNLKTLVRKGLIKKEDRYVGYSLTPKFFERLRELDNQLMVKRLLEQKDDFDEEEFYKWLLNSETVPEGWEFIEAADDEEHEKLSLEYEPEIKEILEIARKAGQNVDSSLLYSWAHYLRKIRQSKKKKDISYGARKRKVGPKTKRSSPFKPKY